MLALFSPLSALSSARAGTSRQPLHCLSLISLALACGSAAQAQSSSGVELFGRLDLGMVAFKGIQAKTTTVLGSGMSHGSFLGVRGEEDLGQGYKAVFVMEHGLHADSGDTNQPEPLSGRRVPEYATRGLPDEIAPVMQAALGDFLIEKTKQPFWGRQALLGLITPVGAVLGGRLYTPAYEIFDRYDPMESGNVADPYALLAVPEAMEVRTSRTLQYRIEIDGLSAALAWSGASSEGLTPTGRFIGGFVGYETPTFSASVAHQQRKNSQGRAELSNTVVGAWWKIDAFKLMGSYIVARNDHPELGLALLAQTEGVSSDPDVQAAFTASAQAVGRQLQIDSHLVTLGVQYRPAPQWRLIANHARLREDKLAAGQAQLWGAAMEYNLSKRTALWTAAAYIDNQADQQVAPITSNNFTGFALRPGQATSALQVSISHQF